MIDRYLYLVDERGTEVKGSRRDVSGCSSPQDFEAARGELIRMAGEGCTVMESEALRRPLFDA